MRRLSNSLNNLVSWLERKNSSTDMQAKFVDLAPTNKADETGVYFEAIMFAMSNPKVSNIALTGPYGSGKSSIIQSFLKKYRRPALHISLAAFVPETDPGGEKASRQEIERSILQQMLYGADANKLPLSRFKRIQSPSIWSIFKSLYITIGSLSLWYVFMLREDIMSGTFFKPFSISNGINLGILIFAIIFLWVTLHHFYVASFGLSLKSISLKDVEIKPAHDDITSILNRHLDEIIYFFQSTDYSLVIIEDLDRFNDAEIFVTLREINSLVNENSGVNRTIRFLYALRDDIFVNTDRTKFFEFIIPVIPIINTSNSIDMVLKQGRRLALDDRLDRQFLREVSRYLNDLRLIQNIFNEYAIYVANLESDGESLLDPNKLLAVLIYKNAYPKDFEQLHRGVGNLAKVLNYQDKLIKDGEKKYRTEIEKLEKELEIAEQQTPSDLEELRKIYAMALIERLPEGVAYVGLDHPTSIRLSQLVNHGKFEDLIEAQHIYQRSVNGNTSRVNISSLQTDVNSQKSYLQRKAEIENKGTDNKNKAQRRIHDLRLRISTLRLAKLNELLRLNAHHTEELFKDFEENGNLARFLILEGHLDDTYYQYTSLFHAGRLSPNDNKFLIQIRAFVKPDPDFPLDNPKEVIAAMRDEDFRQSYVLNIKLVDTLLHDRNLYPDQTQKLFEFISSEFDNCEDFFSVYYASGRNVQVLLLGLLSTWNNLVPTIISSPNNIPHVTQLIANLPVSSLQTLARKFGELSEFVAENLSEILMRFPELEPERLKHLKFKVKDLAEIKEHSEIVRSMFELGLYRLTIANLEYAYQEILGQGDIQSMRKRNLTTIRSTNNVTLIKRVERDINLYLHDVLLELQENSEEDVPAILAILSQDTLDQDDIRKFLERQVIQLPTMEGVPEKLHATLFQLNAIEATWTNCLSFMDSNGFETDSLIDYLDLEVVRAAILKLPMPNDPDSFKLHQLLINASSLSDPAYKDYAHALPESHKELPEGLEPSKLQILIAERKISFTKENLDSLADSKDLQVKFVATNIDTYLNDPHSFALDDDFREALLRSDIDNLAKLKIVDLMDLEELAVLPERSALIGPIINGTDEKVSKLGGDGAQALVTHSKPITTQISLFNKYHSLMSDDEVRYILASLPEPFSGIKIGHNQPKLKNSPENKALLQWLDSRNIISSWSEDRLFPYDLRVNLFRS